MLYIPGDSSNVKHSLFQKLFTFLKIFFYINLSRYKTTLKKIILFIIFFWYLLSYLHS